MGARATWICARATIRGARASAVCKCSLGNVVAHSSSVTGIKPELGDKVSFVIAQSDRKREGVKRFEALDRLLLAACKHTIECTIIRFYR